MGLLAGYCVLSMYLGFWIGLDEITPGQQDGLKFLMVNVIVMPVVLILGTVVGLWRMVRGGILVVVTIVDRDGTAGGYVVIPVSRA